MDIIKETKGGLRVGMFVEIFLLVILIIVNAFFAASEMALVSLNDTKVKRLADEGNKRAQVVGKLLQEPSNFLATIQIGITLAGFLASAFAAESFAGVLADVLYGAGIPLSRRALETISVVVITLILSYFTLVFGELVPKRFALKKPEPLALFAARPLKILSVATSPFVKLLTASTNVFVRLLGVDPNEEDEEVTEEEIRMMVDVGKERGTIRATEKFMIDNIFDFDNKKVSEIMTHRTNISAIPKEATLQELIAIVDQMKFTRYPVYEQSFDNIVGVLHLKDLIPYIEECDADTFRIANIIRKPYFVPESIRTDQLLKEMQKRKLHMAIVIDEYGGTAGVVTLEDLLEEIVGNIFDEYDEEEIDIVPLEDHTFLMSGMMNLDDAAEFLNVKFPVKEYDTLSGFMIGQLGRLPESNESSELEWNGLILRVEEADKKTILKVKVTKK